MTDLNENIVEEWLPWNPHPLLLETALLEGAVDRIGEVLVVYRIKDEPRRYCHIRFPFVYEYRSKDEGDYLVRLGKIDKPGAGTFIAKNSAIFRDFQSANYLKYPSEQLVHYVIASPGNILDIIGKANVMPVVTFEADDLLGSQTVPQA